MGFKKVIKAWETASVDLQISIEIPFIVHADTGILEFPLRICHFGKEKGTIILDINDFRDFSGVLESLGYYASGLNPTVYGKYDREEFIDTLEDWGYYGESQYKPAWYEGKYYK